jgi:hypothetical protein
LAAHSLNEVRYYLTVAVCPACGKGPREIDRAERPDPDTRLTVVTARCRHCAHQGRLEFLCRHDVPTDGVEAETINPDPEPSSLIDPAQWLSLFYLLVESAAGDSSPANTRRRGYQAALCLAEALKFYGDDELPPASAFYCEASAEVFRLHPEKFARQRLRDMQAKLPALSVMARQVARDERPSRRPWWRFWRR